MDQTDLLREQLRARESNRPYATVTILSAEGSAPRRNGKMLVFPGGETMGTIGGGAVEQLAAKDAENCIAEGTGRCVTYDLTAPDSGTGMVCGGKIAVFIEVFSAQPLLIQCGGGHVGRCILRLARFLGFRTLLIDDRDAGALDGAASLADRFLQTYDFTGTIAGLDVPAGSCGVIATHGHVQDGNALRGMLQKDLLYTGMIGSRKKISVLFDALRQEGIADAELARVRAPIGLDLGSETPEEIALSVLAEILLVRSGASGRPLSVPAPDRTR